MADESPSLPFASEEEWQVSPEKHKASPQNAKPPAQDGPSEVSKMFKEMEARIVSQNNKILNMVSRMASDINYINKDLSKVIKIVSKLEYGHERDIQCLNTLRWEFRTFSWKTMSSLRALEGAPDSLIQPENGLWNVYFHGDEDVFSNFYPSPLHLNGLLFKTAEHLYQYRKADFHGLASTVGLEILNANHGGGAKAAAKRLIEVTAEWHRVKGDVMEEVLRVKAAQCREFRERLLATGERGLVHDLPDPLWAWGTHGQGYNLMGLALEKVRAHLQDSTSSSFSQDEEVDAENRAQDKKEEQQGGTSIEANKESLSRQDTRESEPRSEESGRRGRKKGKRQGRETGDAVSSAQDTRSYNLKDDQDWPALPTQGDTPDESNSPASRSPKRQVTSDMSGRSLQVKVSVSDKMEEKGEGVAEREGEKNYQSRQRQPRRGAKYPERRSYEHNRHHQGGGRFTADTEVVCDNQDASKEVLSPNNDIEPPEGERESYQNESGEVIDSEQGRQQWRTQDSFHDSRGRPSSRRPPRTGRGRGRNSPFRGGSNFHGNSGGYYDNSSYHGNNRYGESGRGGRRRGGYRDRQGSHEDGAHGNWDNRNYNSGSNPPDMYDNRMYSDQVQRQGSRENDGGGRGHYRSNQDKSDFPERHQDSESYPRGGPSPRREMDEVGGRGGPDHGASGFPTGHPPGQRVVRMSSGTDQSQQRTPPTPTSQNNPQTSHDQRHVTMEYQQGGN